MNAAPSPARNSDKGKFELADSGTLFLDEISDMSPFAQVKILRALEYGEFERVGSEQMHRSNARIISATNCSFLNGSATKVSRRSLPATERPNVLIPPLRERIQELPALIAAELKAAAVKEGKNITAIHPEAMEKLVQPLARKSARNESHRADDDLLLRGGDSTGTRGISAGPGIPPAAGHTGARCGSPRLMGKRTCAIFLSPRPSPVT